MQPLEYHDAPIPGDAHTDKSVQLYKSNMIQHFLFDAVNLVQLYTTTTLSCMWFVVLERRTKNDRETGIQEEKKI